MSPEPYYFYKGRVALYALLRALRVTPGDEIIVPIYTCPAVVQPIVGVGARAVYCDIESDTLGIAPHQVPNAFTPRTRAIIIQHTLGLPASLDRLVRFARDKGVAILEDCCHVSCSTYKGSAVGRFGDAAFYSFGWGKPFESGGGGTAIINSPWLAEDFGRFYQQFISVDIPQELRLARRDTSVRSASLLRRYFPRTVHRLRSRLRGEEVEEQMPSSGYAVDAQYKWRMSRLSRNRLRRAMRHADQRILSRRQAIRNYEDGLRAIGLQRFAIPQGSDAVFWRYPVFANNKPAVLCEAQKQGVRVFDWGAIPLRSLAQTSSDVTVRRCFPVAEETVRTVITLPIQETGSVSEIASILEFLSNMQKRGFL